MHKILECQERVDLFIPGVDVVGGFSICSPPHQLVNKRSIQLAIKSSPHPPTQWMCSKCKTGDVVSIRVGGDYYYDPQLNESISDLLFIAGGIGINPILSMMEHHVFLQAQRSQSIKNPICQLLYSAKTSDDLIFYDELRAMVQQNNNMFVDFYVTKDQPPTVRNRDIKCRTPFGSFEPHAVLPNIVIILDHRICRDDLELCLSRLRPFAAVNSNLSCYLCGPQSMVDEIAITLQQLGVCHSNINSEKWW